jgi:hypothetical protein
MSEINLARAVVLQLLHHLPPSNHCQLLPLSVAPFAPDLMIPPLQLLLVCRLEEEKEEGGCIFPRSQERGGPSETQSFSSKVLLDTAHSYQN